VDYDLFGVDEWLEEFHCVVEEECGVVVVGGVGEQFDVPWGGFVVGFEIVDQGLGLEFVDFEVVECCVVVDGVRVA